jgi:chromosome segregation ATPase
MKGDYEALAKQCQEYKDTIKRLSELLDEKVKECTSLRDGYPDIDAKQVRELQGQVSCLGSQVNTLRIAYESQRAQNHELHLRLDEYQNLNKSSIRTITDSEDGVEYWKSQCERLRADREGDKTTIEQQHRYIRKLEGKLLTALTRTKP